MKKNRKQWLAALGLLGLTFWGCKNIDLFPNRYIDPEEKYITVKIAQNIFCSPEYLYYVAIIDDGDKVKNDSITKYIRKFENIIILEDNQKIKNLGLDITNPNKNIIRKKIKFKNLRKYESPPSQRDRQCSLQYDGTPWNYPHATLVDIK